MKRDLRITSHPACITRPVVPSAEVGGTQSARVPNLFGQTNRAGAITVSAPPVYRPKLTAQAKPAGLVAGNTPPVYRPKPTAQAKPAGLMAGNAPPVYRPKLTAQAKPAGPMAGNAPPVYRPKLTAQAKPAGLTAGNAPPVYRPKLTAQAKPAGPMAGNAPPIYRPSKVAPTQTLRAKNAPTYISQETSRPKQVLQRSPVVQRLLAVRDPFASQDRITYRIEDLEYFRKIYGNDLDEMPQLLEGVENSPEDIPGLLEDPRRFYVEVGRKKDKEGFYEMTGFEIQLGPQEKDQGGTMRLTTGRIPGLLVRDRYAKKELAISGLISCVGILIEALSEDGGVEAASGSHFVTPELSVLVEAENEEPRRTLTKTGEAFLREQVKLTAAKRMSATLLYVQMGVTPTGAAKDAHMVMPVIAEYLKSLGVSEFKTSRGASTRVYTLAPNGKGTLD